MVRRPNRSLPIDRRQSRRTSGFAAACRAGPRQSSPATPRFAARRDSSNARSPRGLVRRRRSRPRRSTTRPWSTLIRCWRSHPSACASATPARARSSMSTPRRAPRHRAPAAPRSDRSARPVSATTIRGSRGFAIGPGQPHGEQARWIGGPGKADRVELGVDRSTIRCLTEPTCELTHSITEVPVGARQREDWLRATDLS